VVALKPPWISRPDEPTARKQERRGGIETPVVGLHPHRLGARSRNAVVALKPEAKENNIPFIGREAGTPWWH
jgi:hypothetical protein